MSDEAQDLQARLAARLADRDGQGAKGIDMDRVPELMDDREVFRGPIFVIDQQQVAMFRREVLRRPSTDSSSVTPPAWSCWCTTALPMPIC